MKFFVKAKRANHQGIIHIEVSTDKYSVWYRPAISFNTDSGRFKQGRLTGESVTIQLLNKRLNRLENEISTFFSLVKQKKKREPTEDELMEYLYGCSILVDCQRVIDQEEFLEWNFDQQKRYYDFNIKNSSLVDDWQRTVQNCVQKNLPILSSKDLYIFALRYKVESLEPLATLKRR